MTPRRFPVAFAIAFSLVQLGVWAAGAATVLAATTTPVLTSVVSRRLYGTVPYDVPLPLTGASGIEGRDVSNGMFLVFAFDQPVTSGAAAVTAGTATVNGVPSFSANTVSLSLTGVANAQAFTVTLTNVKSTAGGTLATAAITVRTLKGDVNASGSVSAADVNLTKAAVGATISGANYRADVNVNGDISAADVNLVKAAVGTSVAGGPAANTAPTIGAISPITASSGIQTQPVGFAVGDAESTPSALAVSATSSNPTLIAASGITVAGTGESRTLTLTSVAGQTGTATVTLSVSDGITVTTSDVQVTVTPPPTLYLANMTPQGVAASGGSGSSTLLLSGDETYALVRFSYSNMTTPEVAKHVHGPAGPTESGGILFDLDSEEPGPDGSYKWVFVPVGTNTVAAQVAAIKGGRTYINIHSSRYPNGEIRGQYALVSGSQTFAPPPPPPALPNTPPTSAEAARFLTQATYGPTKAEIQNVQTIGYEQWLANQFATPTTSNYDAVYARATTSPAAADDLSATRVVETWWKNSINAPDQLRQRVAFAFSEIFVVSAADEAISGQPAGLATYYDTLARDAFVDFKTLLKDVTLHPIMGRYLNMRGSVRASTGNGNKPPNENYGREVLQLFSVGVNLLQPDGTLKLGVDGLPQATYEQPTIQQFAEVFTGWNSDPVAVVIPQLNTDGTVTNLNSTYNKPMVQQNSGADHSRLQKVLLSYNLPDGTPAPKTLAARGSSHTVDSANAELDFALNNIVNHPNVGPFICRQLIQRLVCSNPSPAYVYRVAQIFADDGSSSHLRGNMQAVIRAILLDYEARSNDLLANQGFGKLREPLLRGTAVIRAFHPTSVSGHFKIGTTETALSQTPLRAPTVFNFFEPGYIYPGPIADAGLVAPEFQITSETTVILQTNFLYAGIQGNSLTGFDGADIKLDLATEVAILSNTASSNPTSDLLDHLNVLLLSGQMTPAMKTRLTTYLGTLSASDLPNKARWAVRLIATSPQFAAQN